MTITIPTWLIWACGGLVGLGVLLLAWVGLVFLWAFRDGFNFRR